MNSNQTYYETGGVNPQTRARTIRIGRLELCYAWLVGYMPTWFYLHFNGRRHLSTTAITLRIFRVILGYRWYRKGS